MLEAAALSGRLEWLGLDDARRLRPDRFDPR